MLADFLIYALYAAVFAIPMLVYLRKLRRRDAHARDAAEKGQLLSGAPPAQHPLIDISNCIGCGSCISVCPEGDVLAMLGGKAAIVNGQKCIGHGLCAEACPVGAITMVMAGPSVRSDMPHLSPERETSVPNLFIAGELGGLALIKNAVNEGRDCVDAIARRLAGEGSALRAPGVLDVLIVGAGPAGIAASLRAIELGLSYLTIERDEVGGTVAKYPRQKLVMTSPVEFPIYGRFRKTELSKEEMLEFWATVLRRADFCVRTGEQVNNVKAGPDGIFDVTSTAGKYRARAVVLALGRAGTPRKLGARGEHLPKVMYRLIEADHYRNKRILVVGGGDSAVEAAMGLAGQAGNQVTLSYRKDSFTRLKDRNAKRIDDFARTAKVEIVFNSFPVEIAADTVVLNVQGELLEIPNDFVWIFAGGEPPSDFLKKIGVQFGSGELIHTGSATSSL